VDFVDTAGAGTGVGAAEAHVTALYQAHALSLARLALVMLGDAGAAEDVVQDAFLGLYRRWAHLNEPAAALGYLRTSVLNGCRTALSRRSRRGSVSASRGGWFDPADDDAVSGGGADGGPVLESAESAVLLDEEHRAVLAAVRRLPDRQREALVLRYYLDMTEEQAAQVMGVSRGTVKSATSRAVAAVGRMLKEGS
jgi:RNA polymerase sigma factor (sigma-70 family)